MASTTCTIYTPTLLGTSVTPKTGLGTGQTMTIGPTTAQSVLDFSRLFVHVYNTGSANTVVLSLGVGTQYSSRGIGAKTLTTVASHATVIIGGQDFEGARFLTSSGTIVFTQTGTGPTTWEAFMGPKATE